MMKINSINAYVKNGKKFVVITTEKGTFVINYGLVKYALDNIQKVKEGK